MSGKTPWTLADAVALCVLLEAVAPHYGAHVALTGGTLYKDGPRKDADILIYRIRQIEYVDVDGLMQAFAAIGVEPGQDYGWCYKAIFHGKPVDFFFPEREGGDQYPGSDVPPSLRLKESAVEDDVAF